MNLYDPPGDLPYGFGSAGWDAEAGVNRFLSELEKRCGMQFVFKDGDAILPRGPELYGDLFQNIKEVDGKGKVTISRLLTENSVELSGPGLYEIKFENVAGGKYAPVAPRRVEVRTGEMVEVVVELRRK